MGPDLLSKERITSAISTALPTLGSNGWLMSVITALVGHPAPFAVATKDFANARHSSRSCMTAPEPVFTSRTKACKPAANFFAKIDDVIKSKERTVPVTSRTA